MNRSSSVGSLNLPRGWFIGLILTIGMVCFQYSNFFSSYYALHDILGNAGMDIVTGMLSVSWATVWAIAFVAIDLAGIARIFTPVTDQKQEPDWVWYLFGAWFLGAAIDTFLTWWSIELSILSGSQVSIMFSKFPNLRGAVPVVSAGADLLIRVLLIRAFAQTFDKLLADYRKGATSNPSYRPAMTSPSQKPSYTPTPSYRPASKPVPAASPRPAEPTYHPVGLSKETGDRR